MVRRPLASCLLAVLALTACRPAHPPPVSVARATNLPDTNRVVPPRFLPWAADLPLVLLVDKRTKRLEVFENGEFATAYPVVLGRGDGRKLHEGDHRTPSGVYHVTGKRKHPRWDRFLLIDYPNADDLDRYQQAVSAGRVPIGARGSRLGPGSQIGIHGTDKEDLNDVGLDWTYGCVSLRNRDVEELYDLVDVGTTVVIVDDEIPPANLQARSPIAPSASR